MTMANTSPVYARIDSSRKDNAETILARLGITPTGAIQMLYSQIVLHRGLPFDVCLPQSYPTAIGGMTRKQLDSELQKGVDSLNNNKGYTAEEIDEEFAQEFGA